MKAIGIDDSVNVCECCGKSNLKSTVVMQCDDGDILHYGSVCASRNSGKPSKQINSEIKTEAARIKAELDKIKDIAYQELSETPEHKALKHRYAIRPHNLIGIPAVDFIRAEMNAYNAMADIIAKKYEIKI